MNIREDNNRYFIHNVKLKEVDASTINLMYGSMINQNQLSTSSINNISQSDEEIKGKYILNREWIDDDLFKVVIRNPENPFYVEAVCKTLKKKIEYYITNGQLVYPIQKGDVEKEALNFILETIENETGITNEGIDEVFNR